MISELFSIQAIRRKHGHIGDHKSPMITFHVWWVTKTPQNLVICFFKNQVEGGRKVKSVSLDEYGIMFN